MSCQKSGNAHEVQGFCRLLSDFLQHQAVHDALYQLIREDKFDKDEKEDRRKDADDLLREICIADKMSSFRAWYVYKAVRWFGKIAVRRKEKYKKKYKAP